MTVPGDAAGADNPFDARFVRPGAVRFNWRRGQSPAALLARLVNNGWRGQIVGPHGSGKSALAAALIEAVEQTGRRAVLVELHDGQRRLPPEVFRPGDLPSGSLLVVDGYEQLSRLSRFLLRRRCRRRKLALVVTAHASIGFPDLARTAVSLEQAVQIVEQLLGDRSFRPAEDELGELYGRHEGDLRETLFDLYDLYERRTRGGGASSGGTPR